MPRSSPFVASSATKAIRFVHVHSVKELTLITWSMQVNDVQFSISGDSILVATGSNQAKLFDRDGALLWVTLSLSLHKSTC